MSRPSKAQLRVLFLAGTLLMVTRGALCADAKGDFALEGAGLAQCSRFSKALAEDSTEVLVFGGWMHGYLTGVNQYREDTYDIATWPSQQQQIKYLGNFCSQNPQRRFFEAVAAMVIQMTPERVVAKEKPIAITKTIQLYPSTLARVRARLIAAGHLESSASTGGEWGPRLEASLKAYQESRGLKETGYPDEATLLSLLRAPGG